MPAPPSNPRCRGLGIATALYQRPTWNAVSSCLSWIGTQVSKRLDTASQAPRSPAVLRLGASYSSGCSGRTCVNGAAELNPTRNHNSHGRSLGVSEPRMKELSSHRERSIMHKIEQGPGSHANLLSNRGPESR